MFVCCVCFGISVLFWSILQILSTGKYLHDIFGSAICSKIFTNNYEKWNFQQKKHLRNMWGYVVGWTKNTNKMKISNELELAELWSEGEIWIKWILEKREDKMKSVLEGSVRHFIIQMLEKGNKITFVWNCLNLLLSFFLYPYPSIFFLLLRLQLAFIFFRDLTGIRFFYCNPL